MAWGISGKGSKFEPMWINRPNPGKNDIKMEVVYCGICHSDCLVGDDLLGTNKWPFIPGHEFIGKIVEVGKGVKKFKVGDHAGVGCLVDVCENCNNCKDQEESYCLGRTLSIMDKKKGQRVGGNPETWTQGGYSKTYVVNEKFAFLIPKGMDLAQAAPVLCGGITIFSPLKHFGAIDSKKKMTVGIIGIGGIGTLGIKFAKAAGHDVMAISTTAAKE